MLLSFLQAAVTFVQQQPPFSLLAYWPQISALLAANWVLTGLVVRAVIDSQFINAFDRCKDRVMNRIDTWYAPRISTVDQAVARVGVHDDQLEGFEASLLRQGQALSEKLGEHFNHNMRALEAITAALGAVQNEAAQTARAVARIEGRMEAEWDGLTNRRKTTRRNPNGGKS